jgi:hypothetical protein
MPKKLSEKLMAKLHAGRTIKSTMKQLDSAWYGQDPKNGATGVEAEILALWPEPENQVSYPDEPGGVTVIVNRVSPVSMEVDDAKLKRSIGADLWEKVSTRTLDKAKLQDAIATGLVSENTILQCSFPVPKKTYITYKEKPIRGAAK